MGVGPSHRRFTHVMQLADMRMIERGDGSRFAFEPLASIRIGRVRFRQHLHRDHAIQPDVGGLVDLAHPAGAEAGDDLVGAKPHAVGEGHDLICLKKNRTRATRKPHTPDANPIVPVVNARSLSKEAACHDAGTIAIARSGAPLPPLIFIGNATSLAPRAGSRSNCARFSSPGTLRS